MSSRNSLSKSSAPAVAGEELVEIMVSLPPGHHGVRFRKESSPPVISEVLDNCSFAKKVKVGDTVTGLILPDNTMMTDLTSSSLVQELRNHREDSGRKLVVTQLGNTINQMDVEVGTVNKDMVEDDTELSEHPSPERTPLTLVPLDSRILQAVTFVLIFIAMFLCIGGTASCRYIETKGDLGDLGDFGFGFPGLELFKSDFLGSGDCVKNKLGSDDFVMYIAQAGSIISILCAALVLFFVGYSLFDPTKWFKKFNFFVLNLAGTGALMTFLAFASCFCGVCVSTDDDLFGSVITDDIFSCGLASGANQFIAAAVFYSVCTVMFCFIDRPTEPLIHLGDCRKN